MRKLIFGLLAALLCPVLLVAQAMDAGDGLNFHWLPVVPARAPAGLSSVPVVAGTPAPAFTYAPHQPTVGITRAIQLANQTFYLYVPPAAESRQPLQVLVALHGMGYNGPAFSAPMRTYADQYGLLLVAPTLHYQDYHDPALVRHDDLLMMPAIAQVVDSLPDRTGMSTRPRILLYGFSRGAQLAHRFALAYPQKVLGVAAISAGSYTLPILQFAVNGQTKPLNFPYGMADLATALGRKTDLQALKSVHFWLAVGAQDTKPQDTPRAWDPYLGTTRVERAQRFYHALQGLGVDAQLTLFPGAGHEETAQMHAEAMHYLLSLQ